MRGNTRSTSRLRALSAGSDGGDHPQSALVEQQSCVVTDVEVCVSAKLTELHLHPVDKRSLMSSPGGRVKPFLREIRVKPESRRSRPFLRRPNQSRRGPVRIHLSSICLDDQDKALRFFTEVLGFVNKTETGGPPR